LIFKDEDDFYRGIFSLFEFNDTGSVLIRERRRTRFRMKKKGMREYSANRDLLVEILAICFMPNHIHLLVRQIKERGIVKFIQKLGTGYAGYFNRKYNRKGHLLGKFYAVHVKNEAQLMTVFVYTHCNPLSLIESKWKEGGIKNPLKAIKFLESYKWSSYLDYIGKKNFPSVTERDFTLEVMGGEKGCRKFVKDWIKYKKELKDWQELGVE